MSTKVRGLENGPHVCYLPVIPWRAGLFCATGGIQANRPGRPIYSAGNRQQPKRDSPARHLSSSINPWRVIYVWRVALPTERHAFFVDYTVRYLHAPLALCGALAFCSRSARTFSLFTMPSSLKSRLFQLATILTGVPCGLFFCAGVQGNLRHAIAILHVYSL